MTAADLTPEAARTALDAMIRGQLTAAFQRGVDTAPHGIGAQADTGAATGFGAINAAVDDLIMAVIRRRVDLYPPVKEAGT